MGTTKVRANQIFGISNSNNFGPVITKKTPGIVVPSSVNEIVLEGSFFNPNTTVTTTSDNVISNVNFIDDNKIIFQLTASATEGTYSFTIDNGIDITTFSLSVILGTAYLPTPEDWEDKTNQIDVSEGDAIKLVTFQQYASARWNQIINPADDVSVRFTPRRSPKGDYVSAQYRVDHIMLRRVSDNSVLTGFSLYKHSTGFYNNIHSTADAWNYTGNAWTSGTWEDRWEAIENAVFEWRFVNGVMYFYINGNLTKTFSDTVFEDLKLDIHVNEYEFKDIKYVVLP